MPLRPVVASLVAATTTLAALGHTPAEAAPAASLTAAVTPVGVTEPLVPLPATGTLTVLGKGFGHGRGMSQYGAAAAASKGRTWQQITSFYYTGAAVTDASTTTLRVGLADTIGTGLRVRPTAGLTASDGRTSRVLPTTDTRDGVTSPIVRWEVQLPAGGAAGAALWFVTADGRRGALAAAPATWTFSAPSGRLQVTSATGTPGAVYLGTLSGTRSGTTIVPVLRTALESYVRMVVPSESIPSWPVQALAAQAVAARTYALSYLRTSTSPLFDICSSTRCQVVGSITTETANSRDGVSATAGKVLTNAGIPIRAEFSSSNGGWTADGDVSYLTAKADADDRSTANPHGAWRADVPVSRIATAFPAVGTPTGIQVLTRDGQGDLGGRVLTARVVGTAGTKTVTGDALRSALGTANVRSTLFALAGAPSRPDGTSGPVLGATSSSVVSSTSATTTRTVTASTAPRALTQVGEWDDVPGNDAIGISSTGDLVLVSGVGSAGATRRVIGRGFGDVARMTSLADMNGDRQRDLVLLRGTGHLVRLTADGKGGLLPGKGSVIGNGWSGIPAITGADVDGDGRDELVAQLWGGAVVAYPASRDVLGTRVAIGTAAGYRSLTSTGDRTGDGRDDLVALDSSGTSWLIPVLATGRLGAPTRLAAMTGVLHLL